MAGHAQFVPDLATRIMLRFRSLRSLNPWRYLGCSRLILVFQVLGWRLALSICSIMSIWIHSRADGFSLRSSLSCVLSSIFSQYLWSGCLMLVISSMYRCLLSYLSHGGPQGILALAANYGCARHLPWMIHIVRVLVLELRALLYMKWRAYNSRCIPLASARIVPQHQLWLILLLPAPHLVGRRWTVALCPISKVVPISMRSDWPRPLLALLWRLLPHNLLTRCCWYTLIDSDLLMLLVFHHKTFVHLLI